MRPTSLPRSRAIAETQKVGSVLARTEKLFQPVSRTKPSEWGRCRRYPASAGRPGRRDPSYTPYMVAFIDAFDSTSHGTLCFVCGSQMGKTDGVLDMVGWRLDLRPRPQLYVGPDKEFLINQVEPRIMALLDEAPTLRDKVARGKRMRQTRKLVSGVPLRLGWAGSPAQLSSDQAGDVYVDELDRMGNNVGDEGNVLALVRARGFTYRDRKVVVTSTPKKGVVEVDPDHASGLVFWRKSDPRDLDSPIWKLWQSGTREHWAWPCPQCDRYFIPRFTCLRWPAKATAFEARTSAYLVCPRDDCGGIITEADKTDMNARGVYVAPGQSVDDGAVQGDLPEALTRSFWVSGLASPFVSFGERAAAWIEAVASGDQEEIKGVINTDFGELFAPGRGGEVPEWTEVSAKRRVSSYLRGELPDGVLRLTLAADVQRDGIWWTIRGWGSRATSWLIDHGKLQGVTTEVEVWTALADLIATPIHGLPIRWAFVDSGFRPGKLETLPINRVYDFCRRFPRNVRPTKGSSSPMRVPLTVSRIEVARNGKTAAYGLELVRLDTDHWKSWVHERVRWPEDQPGAWHLPIDTDDDFCKQIVSEARLKLASGRVKWDARGRDNHYLDCEAMQAAAGYMLNAQRLSDTSQRRSSPVVDKEKRAASAQPAPTQVPVASSPTTQVQPRTVGVTITQQGASAAPVKRSLASRLAR